jgi:hypothetical protein
MRGLGRGYGDHVVAERHRHRLGQEPLLEGPPLALPPGSLTDIEYRYAHDVVQTKPGFQTTLNEAYFRLRHLGCSLQETKTKFDAAVSRWNRTADLRLSFEDFHSALTGIDFASLTSPDLEPLLWDFRAFVTSLLAAWDTDGAQLEEFIASLDFALTLRGPDPVPGTEEQDRERRAEPREGQPDVQGVRPR